MNIKDDLTPAPAGITTDTAPGPEVSAQAENIPYLLHCYNHPLDNPDNNHTPKAIQERLCQAVNHHYHWFSHFCPWLPCSKSEDKNPHFDSVGAFDDFLERNLTALVAPTPEAQSHQSAQLIALIADERHQLSALQQTLDTLKPADLAYIARHCGHATAQEILENHWQKFNNEELLAIARTHSELVFQTLLNKQAFADKDPMDLLVPLARLCPTAAEAVLGKESAVIAPLHDGHRAAIAVVNPQRAETFYQQLKARILRQEACTEDDIKAFLILTTSQSCARKIMLELAGPYMIPEQQDRMALEVFSWHPQLMSPDSLQRLLNSENNELPTVLYLRQYPYIYEQFTPCKARPEFKVRLVLRYPHMISQAFPVPRDSKTDVLTLLKETGQYFTRSLELAKACDREPNFAAYFLYNLYHGSVPDKEHGDLIKKYLVSPWSRRLLRDVFKGEALLDQCQPAYKDAEALTKELTHLPIEGDSHWPMLLRYPVLMRRLLSEPGHNLKFNRRWITAIADRDIHCARTIMASPHYSDQQKAWAAMMFTETLKELLESPALYSETMTETLRSTGLVVDLLSRPHQKALAARWVAENRLEELTGDELFTLVKAHDTVARVLAKRPDLIALLIESQWNGLQKLRPCLAKVQLDDSFQFYDDEDYFCTPATSTTELAVDSQESTTGADSAEGKEVEVTPVEQEPMEEFVARYYDLFRAPTQKFLPWFLPWNQTPLLGWRARGGGICSGHSIYLALKEARHPQEDPMVLRYRLSERQRERLDTTHWSHLPDKLDFLRRNRDKFLGEPVSVSRSEDNKTRLDTDKLLAMLKFSNQLAVTTGRHTISVFYYAPKGQVPYIIVDDSNEGSWKLIESPDQKQDLEDLVMDRLMHFADDGFIQIRPILVPEQPVRLHPPKPYNQPYNPSGNKLPPNQTAPQ
ncbi:hypothetical protein [Parendozoicomonas haliclonae]|uniref:Uncharacterized protein n=1 Tax=Parendozoicomonas haliclonae TaxID=1960125 RepID=A0A1X7AMB1_9GAMM|nr:hypothetical protein [Parendozoicomonas haliclonae]SMA47139.1 hypothetical protein EHSB41UT_02327 [Parendozoicomonas haliclonae]